MAAKVPPKGGLQFNVHIDQRDVDRVTRRLDKMQGSSLKRAAQKAVVAGAALLVSPIRAAAPAKTGRLRRRVGARSVKIRPGEIAAAYAGTRIYYGAWVQDGTSRGIEPNQFVRNVTRTLEPAVESYIAEQVKRLTDG